MAEEIYQQSLEIELSLRGIPIEQLFFCKSGVSLIGVG
jgi:hypothetical protein